MSSGSGSTSKGSGRGLGRWRGRWRWRWRRQLVWGVLGALSVVVVGGVVLTRPFVLTPLLSWRLSMATGVEVRVERAEWSWDGRVDLIGVRMDLAAEANGSGAADGSDRVAADAESDTAEAYRRLLEADRVSVGLSAGGWWSGRGVLDSVAIEGPVLRVVEDASTGRVNLRQWLLAGRVDEAATEKRGSARLPRRVDLRGGRIVVERRALDGSTVALADLPVRGRFEPVEGQAGVQRLWLEESSGVEAGATPLVITGTMSSGEGGKGAWVSLSVADFDVSRPLGVLAPQAVRAWWSELDPAGALPTLRTRFADEDGMGLRLAEAELELDGLEFSVPLVALGLEAELVEGAGEADEPYALRMTDVDGRFVLAEDAVTVEGLTGLIEGLRYHVKGTAGLESGAGIRLQVHTDVFELPEKPPFILRLPAAVRKIYDEYKPRGPFRASAIIDRSAGQSVTYSGAVEVLGAEAVYHAFAYPLEAVTGVITFDENGLAFDGLRGRGASGAEVVISGWVTDPGPAARADVTIAMSNVPVDEALYGALNEKARRSIAMFLDASALAELRSAGLVFAEGDSGDDGFSFDLENRAGGRVRIVRDLSVAPKSQVTTRIEAAGLRLLFEFFPYPLEVMGGALVVTKEAIEMEGLTVSGPGGASASVVGSLVRDGLEGPYVPDLTVEGISLPVNDWLSFALPEVAASWLADFSLTGQVSGSVRVTGSEDVTNDAAAWRVAGRLSEGTARPFGGGFEVEGLSGGFEVDAERTRLVGLRGRRGAGVVDVSATIEHGHDAAAADGAGVVEPGLVLEASATNLAIEPAWADLIPPGLSARSTVSDLFETYGPSGRTDAALSLVLPGLGGAATGDEADGEANEQAGEDMGGERFSLSLMPRRVAVNQGGVRVTAESMSGVVRVLSDHVRVEGLRGVLPRGRGLGAAAGGEGLAELWASADGVWSLGLDDAEGSDTALSFAGRLSPGSALLRGVLPTAVTSAIASLGLEGDVVLESARWLERAEPGDAAAMAFDATVGLEGNTADVGVALTGLTGTLEASVRAYEDGRPTRLDLALSAPSVRAEGRRVDGLAVSLSNGNDPDWLALESLSGRVYGGMLSGRGGVPLTGTGRYGFSVSLQESALGPLLDPATEPAAADGDGALEREKATGLLSAELTLGAEVLDGSGRSGNGALVIRDAKLFERRNAVALLRALNFALPSTEPLDRAQVEFTLEDELVRFRRLVLAGPGLRIDGVGTMGWPSTALDLLLTSRNVDAPRLGVISDVLDALKDELVGIRVTGTVAEPVASLTTLSGTRRKAGEILGSGGLGTPVVVEGQAGGGDEAGGGGGLPVIEPSVEGAED